MHSPEIDLFAPGGLEALFAFHKANFPEGAVMEDKSGESGGDSKDGKDGNDDGKPGDPPGGNDDDDDKNLPDGLGDAGKAAIKAERKARKEADRKLAEEKRAREEAERKLREREDKDLTDAEKDKRDAEELRKTNERLRKDNLRLQALANHNVPKDYQYLVTGEDEASFEKSAKDIAALAAGKKGADPVHEQGGGSGSGGGGDKSGGSVAAGREIHRQRHQKNKVNS